MTRIDTLLSSVFQQLGGNRFRQQWIAPDQTKHGEQSICGLADDSKPVVTISPIVLVRPIIHECLHRHYPRWRERGVLTAESYLYERLDDAECRAIYDAYARRVKIVRGTAVAVDE